MLHMRLRPLNFSPAHIIEPVESKSGQVYENTKNSVKLLFELDWTPHPNITYSRQNGLLGQLLASL